MVSVARFRVVASTSFFFFSAQRVRFLTRERVEKAGVPSRVLSDELDGDEKVEEYFSMSALTHALDESMRTPHRHCDRHGMHESRDASEFSRDSMTASSPETFQNVANAHGGISAISLLRANVWEEASRRGEAGEPDAKTRALLETENAENMFVGRKTVEIEQIASFGNIHIAPAMSGFQSESKNAFGGSRPREVPRVRRVAVYDDIDDDNDATSPGRKRRGTSTSYLAIEADLLSRSNENAGMLCSSPNRKSFTSAPFATVYGRDTAGLESPLGKTSPERTTKEFRSIPFATVYASSDAPSSPASKSSLYF